MISLFEIIICVGIVFFIIMFIKISIDHATNIPTWNGIIISSLIGMLGFYLIMCWIGWMGDKRDDEQKNSET